MTGIVSGNSVSGNSLAELAAHFADPTRANMLIALMQGQAITAGELARHAGLGAPATSAHLARLTEGGLVRVTQQGRFRYYRLAGPEVADLIHALAGAASFVPKRYRPPGPRDQALRLARSCYDHLAGRLAIALVDALLLRGNLREEDDRLVLTDAGRDFFAGFGLALSEAGGKRPLCRSCLDWSERRPHLSGALGAQLLNELLTRGWLRREPESRALALTKEGEAGLIAAFGLKRDWRCEAVEAA